MPDGVASARKAVEAARRAEAAGDFRRAAIEFAQAGAAISGPNSAWALHEAAVAWRRLGEPEEAWRSLELAVAQDDGRHREFSGQLSLTRANALADLGRWEESAQSSMAASEHFQAAGAGVELLYCQIAGARAMAGLGDIASAKSAYKALTSPANPHEIRSQALNNLALLLDAEGQVDAAADLLRQDADLCAGRGDAYGAMVALANAALIFSRSGRDVAARALAGEALRHGDGFEQTPAFGLALQLHGDPAP